MKSEDSDTQGASGYSPAQENAPAPQRRDGAGPGARRSLERPPLRSTPANLRVEDRQFQMMQDAYSSSGGLARADAVARLLRRRSDQSISTLARWIVTRTIVSFEWQSQTLIPLFQFDQSDMSLRAGTHEVICELSATLDDWELACWFAHPNRWLHDAAPADVITRDQAAVLRAARADRFMGADRSAG